MTFPDFWLIAFLNHEGWPRIKGLLIRKKVVSYMILWSAVTQLVRAGIILGALRPKIAVSLLADLFRKRDWSKQPIKELWSELDPYEKVLNQPKKLPEEVIACIPLPLYVNPENIGRDLLEWEFIFNKEFNARYHWSFGQGLVLGLSHHEEASARYEKERKRHITNLPHYLSVGLEVSPEELNKTLEEFADSMEESINAFQNEIRPLAEIPQDLLSLPVIAARLACGDPETQTF